MSGPGAATQSPASNRTGWVVMSALWAVDGTSTVMIFLIGLTLPEIRTEFDISPVQEGYLGAAFFVALTTLSLPSAIWMSRFSPRLVTLLALVGMTIAAVFQGIAPNYWILLIARLMFMYALVSRTQAEVMLIQQWFSGPRIATLNSITVASFGIGQLVAIGLVSGTDAPCWRMARNSSPARRRVRRRGNHLVHRRAGAWLSVICIRDGPRLRSCPRRVQAGRRACSVGIRSYS